ncbi:HAD-IA family hydrolase [Streptococcaceae bacterium ESL0687]|nr:HAD-IA family hydrolase [Streptococcaceae bacterium ESL0687]
MNHYFFDLDGTIINSEIGIKNTFRHTFKELGLEEPSDETLTSFIGPSLEVTFSQMGDQDFVNRALEIYRSYYTKYGMFEAEIYPDILETIEELRKNGAKTYIATSKYEPVAQKTLEVFKINDYFDDLTGSFEGRHTKTAVLKEALRKSQADKNQSLMIGDRSYDITGGSENGLQTVGVLYGFGDLEELEAADASYIISNPKELLEI